MPVLGSYLGREVTERKYENIQYTAVKAKFHYASWFGAGSMLVRAEIWPII